MRFPKLTIATVAAGLVCLLALPLFTAAEDEPPAGGQPAADRPDAGAADDQVPLSDRVQGIARRYGEFEETLIKMHEYLRKTDPERAQLLIRAHGRSKDARILSHMEQISAILERKQFGSAAERQEELIIQLTSLLKLLQSEERDKFLKDEQARIEDILKDVNRLIGGQNDLNVQNARGGNMDRIAERQERLEGNAKRLVEKIDDQDAERARREQGDGEPGDGKPGDGQGEPGDGESGEGEGKPGEGESGEGKPGEGEAGEGEAGEGKPGESGEGKPGEGKPGEGEPGEGKPGEGEPGEGQPGEGQPGEGQPGEGQPGEGQPGEGQPGEGQPGEGQPGEGQPGEGQPGEGQPGEGQPGEGQPGQSDDPNRTPGREQIEEARQAMERAIEELKKKNRENASDEQEKALAELQAAKEKLEEILRQLREEERELLLAALEARFQKMLAMQLLVNSGTVSVDKTPKEQWTSRHFGRCRDLSRQEDEIALEAAKALELLQGEGSSIAFPEAIMQIREDMLLVARRLEREDVGAITQAIERDIAEALSEIIEALQKEMEKSDEEQQQQQQQQQQGDPQDPALVDQLAELKMLRSLQYRINRRTQQLGRLIDGGEQAEQPELIEQLQDLSRRQARVQDTTYNLATGRNR